MPSNEQVLAGHPKAGSSSPLLATLTLLLNSFPQCELEVEDTPRVHPHLIKVVLPTNLICQSFHLSFCSQEAQVDSGSMSTSPTNTPPHGQPAPPSKKAATVVSFEDGNVATGKENDNDDGYPRPISSL